MFVGYFLLKILLFFKKILKICPQRLDISFNLYYNIMWLKAKGVFFTPKNGREIGREAFCGCSVMSEYEFVKN